HTDRLLHAPALHADLLVLLEGALRPPPSTLFPYTTLFRSPFSPYKNRIIKIIQLCMELAYQTSVSQFFKISNHYRRFIQRIQLRSEEHTSELQSRFDLVCRLLLEKKNK